MRHLQIPHSLKMARSIEECTHELGRILTERHFQRPAVITGERHSVSIATTLCEGFADQCTFVKVSSPRFSDVQRIEEHLFVQQSDCVVAIGGGKVLDAAKYAAFRSHVPLLVVPTQASHDGIASPVAVIEGADGRKMSLGTQMPLAVIVPISVIADSPVESIRAGIGDLLSNQSALNDWLIAEAEGKESYDDFSALLSKNAVHLLDRELSYTPNQRSVDFVEVLVEGLVLSGLSMAISGTSRPCSGSEHLISHSLDLLGLSEANRHGVQVGSAGLFCLYLQSKLTESAVRNLRAAEIPLTFADLSPNIRPNLRQVFDTAKEVRPGRYTILDRYTTDDLITMYRDFEAHFSAVS